MTNKFGRKKSLIGYAVILIAGWITVIYSEDDSNLIIIGRAIKVSIFTNFQLSLDSEN